MSILTDLKHLFALETPVTLRLGALGCFPGAETGADYDVVYITVDSHDLHRLNQKVRDNISVEVSHPNYTPHITLAYVKLGEGKEVLELLKDEATLFIGHKLFSNTISFSNRDGKQTQIRLGGTDAMSTRLKYDVLASNIRQRLSELSAEHKGGAGSGNFNHGGRPGERGGSSSEGGGSGPGGLAKDDVKTEGRALMGKEDKLYAQRDKARRNYDDDKVASIDKRISSHQKQMRAFEDKHGVILDQNSGVVFQDHIWNANVSNDLPSGHPQGSGRSGDKIGGAAEKRRMEVVANRAMSEGRKLHVDIMLGNHSMRDKAIEHFTRARDNYVKLRMVDKERQATAMIQRLSKGKK